jgi:archaemetzincin
MNPKVLQLVAIGSPPASLLRDVEEPLRSQLGLQPVQGKVSLQAPTYAFNKDRHQYNSSAIMRRVSPLLVAGQNFALGLLDVDLFVPDSPFIFGEADREAKTALVSIFRLRQGADGEALRRRVQVEVVHEAGHLLGLSYCEDARCVMFLATSVAECDRKGIALCNICRNELQKLNR